MDSIKGSDNKKIFYTHMDKTHENLYIKLQVQLSQKNGIKINSGTSPLFTLPHLHVIFLYNPLHLSSYLSLYVNLLL